MLSWIRALVLSAVTLACLGGGTAGAQQIEPRLALVIGNAGYRPGALPTALNDAGLVAEALRSIGFQITEGANLSQPDMLRLFRSFLAKVDASGPDALAFVYFSGHGLSFEGENYLLGVDARIDRDADIPIEGVRLSDLLRPLADAPAFAKVVMVDAARPLPFRPQGRGLAPGLEALEPPQGMLIAFSSAPGTIAPDGRGPYGAYATAIAEMLRAPGIDLDTAFTHIRSRTHLSTQGSQTPWHVSDLGDEIELVPPDAADASLPQPQRLRAERPMRELDPDEAYALAIEMDTLDGYVTFVDAYPRHAYAARIWAMIRARREALAWMRAVEIDTPQAYWTYLRRYPDGVYGYDAERRLRRLRAASAPPPGFALLELLGVPLALRGEPREYQPVYRVGPPPPRRLMRPPPASLANLPPPRRAGPRGLPQLSTPIPMVPRLGSAPRHGRPAARRPATGAPPAGTATRTPTAPPAIAAPPQGQRRPPGAGGPPPAGTATRTPNAPPAIAAPPQGGRRPPDAGSAPGGKPRSGPGIPPSGPPPTAKSPVSAPPAGHAPRAPVVKPPTLPPAAKLSPPASPKPPPPPRVTTPTPTRQAAPPRPAPPVVKQPPPAARAAPKPQACPAGKSLKVVGGNSVCG